METDLVGILTEVLPRRDLRRVRNVGSAERELDQFRRCAEAGRTELALPPIKVLEFDIIKGEEQTAAGQAAP